MENNYKRPRFVLTAFKRVMKDVDIWKVVESKLADYKAKGTWPSWCFLPVKYAGEIIGGPYERLSSDEQSCSPFLAAMAAWRQTQAAYTYDPTVFDALWKTPVTGKILVQIFYHLPDWCVYILTPGKTWMGKTLHGFLAHADFDPQTKRSWLRLLLDVSVPGHDRNEVDAVPIDLGYRTIHDSIEHMLISRAANDWFKVYSDEELAAIRLIVPSLVSLVLYLCEKNAEIFDVAGGKHSLQRPKPTKTKQGLRLFPPDHPTQWNVAYRLGAALRREWAVRETGDSSEGGTRAKPRPHIRRAHWQSYWVGKLSQPETRRVVVKWLPPIAVNVKSVDDLTTTVREVGQVTVTHMTY